MASHRGFRNFGVTSRSLDTDVEFWAQVACADAALEGEAQRLIDNFVGVPHDALQIGVSCGVMVHHPLERAIASRTSATQSLAESFIPVREMLLARHGSVLPLYRAQSPVMENSSPRMVLSWTSSLDFAFFMRGGEPREMYAVHVDYGDGGGVYSPDEQYDLPDGTCLEVGDVLFSGPHAEAMAGEKAAFLQDRLPQWRFHVDREVWDPAEGADVKILAALVPIEDIVWITNRARQREFIVRNRGVQAVVGPLLEGDERIVPVDIQLFEEEESAGPSPA